MHFDFSGAELFLSYLAGTCSIHDVFEHPAYRAVCRHARLYSDGLSARDVEQALCGKGSPFYGLEGLPDRMQAIRALLAVIRAEQERWASLASREVLRVVPEADLDITVYPIIGYDMGIGLDGSVCMNLNHKSYLSEPNEFLFFMVHECIHVIYERCHRVPALAEVSSPAEWRSYFNLWLQNEGYAVYAPFRLRQALGFLDERDYRVLLDAGQLDALRASFLKVLRALESDALLPAEQYLDYCFGEKRLSYRIGCELVRRIEEHYGMEAVTRAFYLSGDAFVKEYRHLLD